MKLVIRVILYLLGLFFIAIGINLAIISNLGVSPVSAFIVPISQITKISLGIVTVFIYILFVVIQKVLLGENFHKKNLLQVPFALAVGFFIDFTGVILRKWITATSYQMQLMLIFLSIIICAFGAVLYILMDIVPNPPEGLLLAIFRRTGIGFGKLKVWSDCIFVLIGIVISLIFMRHVYAIREGTIICALLTGKAFGIFQTYMEPAFKKIGLVRH